MPWELREKDAVRDFAFYKELIKAQWLNGPRLMYGSNSTFIEISLDGAWSQGYIEKFFAFCKSHGYEATLATRSFNEQPRFVISYIQNNGDNKL